MNTLFRTAFAIGSTAFALVLVPDASAQSDQTWLNAASPNEWSLSAPTWDAGVGWTNGNNAIFGGTAETVEMASDITVNNITFNTSGWIINDANDDSVLTLSAGSIITASTGTVTINESMAGGSLTKAGTGTLQLGGSNTYTGATVVDLGLLNLTSSGALDGTSGVTVNTGGTTATAGSVGLNNVTIAGKSIRIAGTGADNVGALKATGNGLSVWTGNVTIAAGNTRIGATQGTGILEISGVIDSEGVNRGLNIRGGSGTSTVLLSNVNTYVGNTSVVVGTLKVGVTNALPTGTSVVMGNSAGVGSATFDLNGFDQQVVSISNVSGANIPTLVTNSSASAAVLTIANGGTNNNAVTMTGNLSLVKNNGGLLALSAASDYDGSTTVNAGTLELNGANGSLTSTEFVLNGGVFHLNNNAAAGTNNDDRIDDSATLTFRDGDFTFSGTADAGVNSSETFGSMVLDRGFQTMRINFNGTNTATLNSAGFTRSSGGGVVFMNGLNLGANGTATESIARIFTTAVPTLLGGTDALATGINAGVFDTKIVPYLVGYADEVTGATGGVSTAPNTFMTYNSEAGYRPLNPIDEFAQDVFTAGANTRLTASIGVAGSVAVNSLLFDSGGGPTLTMSIAAGQTLTVTSGTILFSSGSNTINGGTLDFGAAEGIIYANGSGNSTINSRITGTGGLTIAGNNLYVPGNSTNSYSGDTTLLSGTTVPTVSSVGPAGAPTSGPFGTGNLVLAGGNMRGTSGQPSITIGNNIIFKADTTIVSGGNNLVLSGGVTLAEGDRVLTHNTSAITTFSGVISDGGQNLGVTIAGSGSGAVVFSNTNTYTGATNVNGSTLLVNGTHATGSAYRVGSGGTLGGGGDISLAPGGSITIAAGGTLSVGNGTNTAAALAITTTGGALTFTDSTSIMRLDIISDASVGSGTDQSGDASRADQLVVSGSVNLNGARLVVGTIAGLDSLTFSAGDRWDLFDWITSFPTGSFSVDPVTDLPTLSAGLMWDLSDIYTGGTIGVAVVPEPSRAMLLVGGVLIGLLRRRRPGR